MLNEPIDFNTELESQLKKWKQRKESLILWITAHDYEHANFNQMISDLRIAENKVLQLDNRIKRQKTKTKTYGMAVSALPDTIRMHYSF